MPIQFTCPHCGVGTQVDDEFAGQTGACRECGQTVTIPGPAGAAPRPQMASPQMPTPGAYGVACPRCNSQSTRPGPWPWYLGTIGAIFVSAKVCNQCGHQFDSRKPEADFAKRKFNLALLINGFGALGILTVFGLLGWLVYATFN